MANYEELLKIIEEKTNLDYTHEFENMNFAIHFTDFLEELKKGKLQKKERMQIEVILEILFS